MLRQIGSEEQVPDLSIWSKIQCQSFVWTDGKIRSGWVPNEAEISWILRKAGIKTAISKGEGSFIRKSSHGGLGLALSIGCFRNIFCFVVLMCFMSIGAIALASQTGGSSVHILNQGDTVHLEFEGKNQWDYEIKKVAQKGKTIVEISISSLNEQGLQSLRSFSGPLVKSISVNTQGPDGKTILTFELTADNIEPFDYLTEKPSRLIVDFFTNTAPAKADLKKDQSNKTPSAEASKKPAKVKSLRSPATSDVLVVNSQGPQTSGASGVLDGSDLQFDRFNIKDYEIKEESIIASKEKVYLEFPMIHLESPYLNMIQSKKPVYEISPNDTDENRQARLLLTLFENKRYNVFLKTVDWFVQKYPDSQYDELIRFMWSDALFGLWLEGRNVEDFDLAMVRYGQTIEKYPQSPLLERTMMLMGFATLDRGDYLGTLRLFQGHLDKRPNSPNKDIAKLAIANAYLKINRYDEASQIYSELEQAASQDKYKVQATFLRGNVAYQRKDYVNAVREYQSALKKYPEEASAYPNAFYNQAAAFFNLGEFRKSLDVYREFLKKYPSREESGYAMTRVGEILDILGADKSRVLGTYLEVYFRFGDTPSSVAARLRMLSEKMATMKPKELEKAVNDIQQLAKQSNLPKVEQFATLMISEGYASRKEFDKANDLLIKYYQSAPNTADTLLLRNRIVKNINENLKNLVDEDNFIEALKLHNKYADNWLKGSERIDTKFNVGRAFEQSGVFSEAEKLYKNVLNQLYALKGTKDGKERNIFEKLPSEDELNLRLASVELQANHFSQSYDYLKNIKSPETLSEKAQIERVLMTSTLLDQRGETDSAIRFLSEIIKVWSGVPELVSDPYLQLAKLEVKKGKIEEAMGSLNKINTLMEDSQKVPSQTHSRALELLGELELKKGNTDQAIKIFETMLGLYENSKPLASFRYKVGDLYFKKGELQKAAQVWNELKGKKDEIWYKMAQAQLNGSEWKNEYQKYIKRIPAMNSEK